MTSNHAFTSPRLRRLFCSLFIVAAAIAALRVFGSSRAISSGAARLNGLRPRPRLRLGSWNTANGQQAEFFVVLTDQADLSGATALPIKNEKGRYVYDALWKRVRPTQGPIPNGGANAGSSINPCTCVNAILVKGGSEIAEMLAARPDVACVEGNFPHSKFATATAPCC